MFIGQLHMPSLSFSLTLSGSGRFANYQIRTSFNAYEDGATFTADLFAETRGIIYSQRGSYPDLSPLQSHSALDHRCHA